MDIARFDPARLIMRRVIVDSNDVVIGAKESMDIDFAKEIYRVSALWLWNSKGEVLIAQRTKSKGNDAGVWGPSVAGTVEAGESYEENIVKETEEEIGLTGVDFILDKKHFVSGKRNYFTQFYKAMSDRSIEEFTLQADEVDAVMWIKPKDLKYKVLAHPEEFVPAMKQCLELL